MYVMISLLTLVVALTFNVCFGSRLQSHYQLLGMTVSELVFLLCFGAEQSVFLYLLIRTEN